LRSMINPGFEASLIQPCYSANIDLYTLLSRLDHIRSHETLQKLQFTPNYSAAFFQSQIHQNYDQFHYNPARPSNETREFTFQNFVNKKSILGELSINEDAKVEEATTTPSSTPKMEVDTADEAFSHYTEQQKTQFEELNHQTKRRFWLPSEDAQLIELVNLYGERWSKIATFIEGRTGKQIRDRYINSLKPGIRQEAWTKEEDELLIKLYLKIGNKWSRIAHCLRGRTENQVKNRFRTFFKRGSSSVEIEEFSKPKKYIKKELPDLHLSNSVKRCACQQNKKIEKSLTPHQSTYDMIPLNLQHLFLMNQLQSQHGIVKQEFHLKEEEEVNIKHEV